VLKFKRKFRRLKVKGGAQLGTSFIVSELVHFVCLECGIAGDAGEEGAEERVWG
jgi:hypothetical protein